MQTSPSVTSFTVISLPASWVRHVSNPSRRRVQRQSALRGAWNGRRHWTV